MLPDLYIDINYFCVPTELNNLLVDFSIEGNVAYPISEK